jgi:WD40 repeat protein
MAEHREEDECIAMLDADESVYALAVVGDVIAVGGAMDSILLWDGESDTCAHKLSGHENSVLAMEPLVQGAALASGSHDETVKIWEPLAGICTATLAAEGGSIYCLAEIADGSLAAGTKDGAVQIWDVEAQICVQTLDLGRQSTVLSAISLGAGLLATGSQDGHVAIWDTSAGNCVAALESSGRSVSALALCGSPGTFTLAAGYGDASVRVWDVPAKRCIYTLPDASEQAPLRTPRHILRASLDSSQPPLEGHDAAVLSLLGLGPEKLVSGSVDATIKVWDLISRKEIATYAHEGTVDAVAMWHDQLVTGSDSMVRIWTV